MITTATTLPHLLAFYALVPVAAVLRLLPWVADAAVTMTPGGSGLDAWTEGGCWTLKVGPVWLEVDWA